MSNPSIRPQPKPSRILILSPPTVYRVGLEALLAGQDSLDVVGGESQMPSVVEGLLRLHPDVVVILPLPIEGGEALLRIQQRAPRAQIVLMGMPSSVEEVNRWIRAGVRGFLSPEQTPADVVAVVRNASAGRTTIPSRADLERARSPADATPKAGRSIAGLSRRECEVLRLLGEGFSNKRIADELGIAPGTVKAHVHAVLAKLKVPSRGRAVALARQELDEI